MSPNQIPTNALLLPGQLMPEPNSRKTQHHQVTIAKPNSAMPSNHLTDTSTKHSLIQTMSNQTQTTRCILKLADAKMDSTKLPASKAEATRLISKPGYIQIQKIPILVVEELNLS